MRNILRIEPIQYSAYDLKVVVRILGGVMIWKLLSLDLSSLAVTVHGPPPFDLNPGFMGAIIQDLAPRLFDSSARIKFVQLASCLVLLLALVSLRRWILILSILPFVVVEWTCYQFRGQLYEIDLILAVLIVIVSAPFSWQRAVRSVTTETNSDATNIGRMAILYVGIMYFLAGLSKPLSDPLWWNNVHLENLEEAMYTWHNAIPNGFLFYTARWIGHAFDSIPFFSQVSAFFTMALELTWISSIISALARKWLPPAMFLIHVIILLGSGISFLVMALVGIVLVIPWRKLRTNQVIERMASNARLPLTNPRLLVAVAVVALLSLFPAIRRTHYHPFDSHLEFGWSYAQAKAPTTVYMMGYWNAFKESYEPLPLNYGGFWDFRHQSISSFHAALLVRTLPGSPAHIRSLAIVRQHRLAIRPHNSNRWLLGPFSFPPHIISKSEEVEELATKDILLLKGTIEHVSSELTSATWVSTGIHL